MLSAVCRVVCGPSGTTHGMYQARAPPSQNGHCSTTIRPPWLAPDDSPETATEHVKVVVETMPVELTPLPTARAVGATNLRMPLYTDTQRAARSARPRQPCSNSQPQRAAAGAHGGKLGTRLKRHAIEHSSSLDVGHWQRALAVEPT